MLELILLYAIILPKTGYSTKMLLGLLTSDTSNS
jgi:hypothetical protein